MSSKRKLKKKIDRLKTALRKSETEMRLLRSDFLVDMERLAYNLHFSEGQVRSLMRDNRVMRDQVDALTGKTEVPAPQIPAPPARRDAEENNGVVPSQAVS
jgi:hypothetical protein